MIRQYPTRIEAIDEDMQENVFVVETKDCAAAEVTISCWVTADSWLDISQQIHAALKSMQLVDDND